MSLPIFKDHDPENPWAVTGESHVIDSKGIISLEYIPLNGSISMDYFTFTNNQLSISPQQFYIDYSVATNYKGATGKVYFNPVNAGTKVIVAYQGVSQLIKAAYMNEVKSHVEDAFKHTPPPASASSFLKSTPGVAPVWNLINWKDIQDKPNFADASWKAAVNTPADLPLSGNHIGDMRVVLNDGDSGAIFECITATGDLVAQWAKIGDFSFATPAWTAITNKPTTLNGYGITDAVNISDIVTTSSANKILKLNGDGILPASITGNAATTTKLATSRTIAITGDATGSATFDGSANASIAATLANSGVTAGTYKSVNVDAKGRVTGGSNPTTLAGYGITDALSSTGTAASATKLATARTISLSGDASGSVSFDGSANAPISLTLANSGVAAGGYNGANITVDAKGRLTAASAGVCGFALTVVPAFGLASAAFVAPFAMSITRIDITSKTAAGSDQAPSASTNMYIYNYKNGSPALTQAFTAANTTNAAVSLSIAAGDVIYLVQSATNGTAQVSLTARGVRA